MRAVVACFAALFVCVCALHHFCSAALNAAPAAAAAVCKHDESGVTCIWEQFAPGDVKVVTVTANASRAGPQPSIAAVTTSSLDINPSNNKATVDVTVLVGCWCCCVSVCACVCLRGRKGLLLRTLWQWHYH